MRPKKSLGQNFLSDPKILAKIAEAAKIEKEDTVVEIGPGKGSLTMELLKKAKKVIAIEKDELLAKNLEEIFSKEIADNRLQIIVADVLDLEESSVNEPCEARRSEHEEIFSRKLSVRENRSFLPDPYKLVGNIPYYITGEIFRKFLESDNQPKSITFVVQKEVAERIVVKEKESILSISIKAYGEPKYGGVIKKGSFFPKPKVDSAIISIFNINKDRFKEITPQHFFELVRTGFAHKRKLLIRNLTNVSKVAFDTVILEETFDKLGIDRKTRAEDLKVEDWFKLAINIYK